MSALTKLARGQDCKVHFPVCNDNPETTVAAHFRSISLGAGIGIKPNDIFAAHCCSSCHDVCDGRTHIEGFDKDTVRFYHAIGVLKTIEWLQDEGWLRTGKRGIAT